MEILYYCVVYYSVNMSLASTREKRFNAGNRMSRMLEEEQEDDFYKTTYGGFEEVRFRSNSICIVAMCT